MKRLLCSAIVLTTITACGGGGSGGGSDTPTVPPPVITPAPTLNVADALNKLIVTPRQLSGLKSNDGSLGTANLSIESVEPTPFATNGVVQNAASTREIRFSENGADGRLLRRNLWKISFDSKMAPLGMSIGEASRTSSGTYSRCHSVTSKGELPASSNASGVYFTGVQSTSYREERRAGVYAQYCDPTASTTAAVEWSVVKGSPNQYMCLTMPAAGASKTRFCLPVDSAGALNGSAWITVYNTDGTPNVDYKDTSLNKPVEQFSTTIDAGNYWYGQVRRPLDGFVYQSFPDTKFSSQQACREQTQIDWKKTWSADNIGWSCINVQAR